MTQVSLEEVPRVLGPVFAAGDAAAGAKERERGNVERIGRMVHCISQGRFDELREQLAPDVAYEMVAPARVPWRRAARGADQVAATIAENFATVCEQRTQPLSLVSQGDTVMLMARETGRFVDDGAEYEVLTAQQFTFDDDGRLAEFRSVVGEVGRPGGHPDARG
ncbi:MAG TPA: nuclear transport factor 2 family protein [Longimicrobium sp.]|nr:nuclear transport factor 2 family protein [Longimicrobium sp.]